MHVTTKPLIGIMANSLQPWPLYDLTKTQEFDLLVFTVKGINWTQETITGLSLENDIWKEIALPFPSVIYNRLYSSNLALSKTIEAAIGEGKVFNYITNFNKWTIYNTLRQSRVKEFLPKTYLYHKINFLELLNHEKVLILKPCKSYFGRQVYLIKLINNSKFQLCRNTNFPKIITTDVNYFNNVVHSLINKRFIVQQFIELNKINNKIYDIRIFVQKNIKGQWTVSGGLSRISFANYYITNFCSKVIGLNSLLESNIISTGTLEQIHNISLYVAKIIETKLVHLGDISVDFGLDTQGKPWIIEINGKTQKSLVFKTNDENLIRATYLKPLEYACFLANNKMRETGAGPC